VKLLEEARSTLIRQPITRFIHKEDQDIYYLHRKQLFESNEPQACELRMVRKDGTTFWIRLSATPPSSVRDTDGEPASRLVMSDITELKRVEEEKAELLAQLRKGQDSRRPGLAPRRRGDDGKIA
jgi:PAS domain S-box-containing protein